MALANEGLRLTQILLTQRQKISQVVEGVDPRPIVKR